MGSTVEKIVDKGKQVAGTVISVLSGNFMSTSFSFTKQYKSSFFR